MNFTQKGIFSLFGKFLGAILALLISMVLARVIGVNGIGQYQLVISTQVVVITILAMGFGNASIYFINSKKIDKKLVVTTLFKLFSFISLFLAIILGFCLVYFVDYFGELSKSSIFIFVIGSASLLMYNILMPTLYASLEVVKLQVLSLISNTVVLIGIGFTYLFSVLDINGIISIVGLGNVLVLSILLYYLRNYFEFSKKFETSLMRKLFLYGIKISATNLVFVLSSNIVIFVMKYLLEDGFKAVGLFSRATAIANMFLIIPATLGPLFYSKWAGYSQESLHKNVEKTLNLMFLLTIFCAFFILLFGEKILIILYGQEFIGAKVSLNILSISVIFSSLTIILTNVFSGIGKPLITFKVFIVSLLLTTLSSLFLINYFGIEGAAISILLGIMYNTVALIYFCKKEINLKIINIFYIDKNQIKKIVLDLKSK